MSRKRPGKTSSEVGLDLEARDRLIAAVFDANCFSRGRPDLEQLRYLAERLAEIGIETWIPEPVAWEWAQHIGEDWDTVRVGLGDENKRVIRAGVTGFQSAHADSGEAAEEFLRLLEQAPDLVSVPLSPASARDGLRDQVLLKPPGRRKEGVKTGASDSAWLRDVLHRADGDASRLLFVSEDKDIPAALSAWGKGTPLMRPLRDLLATLFTVTVDTGAATRALIDYALTQFPAEQGSGVLDAGPAPGLQATAEKILDLPYDGARVAGAAISRITGLAGITSVAVESPQQAQPGENETAPGDASSPGDGGTRPHKRGMYGQDDQKSLHTIMATMLLLADAEVVLDQADDDEAGRHVTGGVSVISDVLLHVSAALEMESGIIVRARTEGDVLSYEGRERFDSDDEALECLVDALTGTVPGLELPEGWPHDKPEFEQEVNGREIRVDFSVVDIGAWSVEVQIDGEAAELSCNYDPDARVWLGREDSFDMPGAYPVKLDGSASPNPPWALLSWIMQRLWG